MSETPTVWDLFDLTGRTAVVTGGPGELGSRMCDALAEAGANVVVASRAYEDCAEKARELSSQYGEALPVAADVTDEDSARDLVDTTVEVFGSLDVLVNNASRATGYGEDFEDLTRAEWTETLEGVLTRTFVTTQAALPAIRESDAPSVVNVASHAGVVPPDQRVFGDAGVADPPTVGSANAGVVHFTKWVASSLREERVRVNAISPGGFDGQATEATEADTEPSAPDDEERPALGRVGHDTGVKGLVVYLASDASEGVTGQNVVLDGGRTMW